MSFFFKTMPPKLPQDDMGLYIENWLVSCILGSGISGQCQLDLGAVEVCTKVARGQQIYTKLQ